MTAQPKKTRPESGAPPANRAARLAMAKRRKLGTAPAAPSATDAHAARATAPRAQSGAARRRRFDGHSRHRG